MSEPTKTERELVDVYDELTLRLTHIVDLLDVMSECDKEQCNINGAAHAIGRIVEDAAVLAGLLYHAGEAS